MDENWLDEALAAELEALDGVSEEQLLLSIQGDADVLNEISGPARSASDTASDRENDNDKDARSTHSESANSTDTAAYLQLLETRFAEQNERLDEYVEFLDQCTDPAPSSSSVTPSAPELKTAGGNTTIACQDQNQDADTTCSDDCEEGGTRKAPHQAADHVGEGGHGFCSAEAGGQEPAESIPSSPSPPSELLVFEMQLKQRDRELEEMERQLNSPTVDHQTPGAAEHEQDLLAEEERERFLQVQAELDREREESEQLLAMLRDREARRREASCIRLQAYYRGYRCRKQWRPVIQDNLARRRAEEERRAEEQRILEEQRRLAAEQERQRQAEQERQRQLDKERRNREEAERQRRAEQKRRQEEQERRCKEEEERQRQKEEEERLRIEAEKEAERQRKIEEEKRIAEEIHRLDLERERQRLEMEKRRMAQEAERQRLAKEAEEKRERERIEAETRQRRQEEERKKQAEEAERQRVADQLELKRLREEEERRRQAEEECKRRQEEKERQERLKRQVEEKRQLELRLCRENQAATMLQALVRGYLLRTRLYRALCAAQIIPSGVAGQDGEDDEDDFDYDQDIDLIDFDYDEDSLKFDFDARELEALTPLPLREALPTPKAKEKQSVPSQAHTSRQAVTLPPITSPTQVTVQDSPGEHRTHVTQHKASTASAVSNGNTAQTGQGIRGNVPAQQANVMGLANTSDAASTTKTKRSEHAEKVAKDWGFSDTATVDLMRQRAMRFQGRLKRQGKGQAKEQVQYQWKEFPQRQRKKKVVSAARPAPSGMFGRVDAASGLAATVAASASSSMTSISTITLPPLDSRVLAGGQMQLMAQRLSSSSTSEIISSGNFPLYNSIKAWDATKKKSKSKR
eukprot:scpid28142/ scgid3761/ 